VKRLLLVVLCALALPSAALGSYTPKIVVDVDGSGRLTTFKLSGPETDDPTAKITIFVPRGWDLATPAPGTRIGTGKALALLADLGGAKAPFDAVLETADPAAHTQNECDARLHRAVWILVLSAFGNELRLPLYVDPAEGAEAAIASWRIQTCLAPPDLPEGSPGRAAFGAKLIDAELALSNIVSVPAGSGQHVFSALYTPYVPKLGTHNVTGMVETRSLVALPRTVTFSATKTRFTGVATQAGQPVAGAAVKLSVRNGRVKTPTLRTNAAGRFSWTVNLPRGGKLLRGERVGVVVTVPESSVACSGQSLAPAGCVGMTLGAVVLKGVARVK